MGPLACMYPPPTPLPPLPRCACASPQDIWQRHAHLQQKPSVRRPLTPGHPASSQKAGSQFRVRPSQIATAISTARARPPGGESASLIRPQGHLPPLSFGSCPPRHTPAVARTGGLCRRQAPPQTAQCRLLAPAPRGLRRHTRHLADAGLPPPNQLLLTPQAPPVCSQTAPLMTPGRGLRQGLCQERQVRMWCSGRLQQRVSPPLMHRPKTTGAFRCTRVLLPAAKRLRSVQRRMRRHMQHSRGCCRGACACDGAKVKTVMLAAASKLCAWPQQRIDRQAAMWPQEALDLDRTQSVLTDTAQLELMYISNVVAGRGCLHGPQRRPKPCCRALGKGGYTQARVKN